MSFLLKKCILLFFTLSSILAEIPLDQEVYITNKHLVDEEYVFTIGSLSDPSMEDGALLRLEPNEGLENQKFIISERNGYFVIRAKHSGKLLTAVEDNNYVIQEHDLGSDPFTKYYEKNQLFSILSRDAAGVIYAFYSFSRTTLLQFNFDFDYVNGHWIKISDEVMQAIPTYGDPQKWQFIKVSQSDESINPPNEPENTAEEPQP